MKAVHVAGLVTGVGIVCVTFVTCLAIIKNVSISVAASAGGGVIMTAGAAANEIAKRGGRIG